MVKHVVVWKLKEENKTENAKEMKRQLEKLPALISQIKSLEVGINENGGEYDVILITSFDSYDDLKTYDAHPEHQKVRTFIRGVVKTRIAVDYQF